MLQIRYVISLFVLSGFVTSVHAAQKAPRKPEFTGAPQLSALTPDYVQRGASVDATLTGAALEGATRVVIEGQPGLEATLVVDDNAKDRAKSARIKLTAAADCAPGVRELRLIATNGVSNTITVAAGVFPQVVEKEPNNTPEQAQIVTLPAILSGAIDGAGDVDMFRFTAKKGETLVFDVSAARNGSKLDARLHIFDLRGQALAHNEDAGRADALLNFTPPADGDYLLQIHDLRYQGGKEFFYRIAAGAVPHLDAVFPPGGRRGTTVQVQPRGENLDTAAPISVAVPAAADLLAQDAAAFSVRATSPLGLSNAVPFNVSDFPEVNETEPNDTPQTANAIEVPTVVNGTIASPSDSDYFRFHAKKGQKLVFEAVTARIRSPLDPLLTLLDTKGGVLAEDTATQRIERAFDADGEFVIGIRDLTEHGGAAYTYRLYVSEPRAVPRFTVKFTPERVLLHRGAKVKVWCDIVREAGFIEDIRIAAANLPKGVTVEPYIASIKNPNSGILLLSADENAEVDSAPLKLVASSTLAKSKEEVTRAAEPQLNKRAVASAWLSVLDHAGFRVEAAQKLAPEEREKLVKERDALTKKLSEQTPELDAAQAKWEAGAVEKSAWVALEPHDLKAKNGATLKASPDGTVTASGTSPAMDVYTFHATLALPALAAVRLEALSDSALPSGGPGRSSNGNFVLTELLVRVASGTDPKAAAAAAPIKFVKASADFGQSGFTPELAINGSRTGWAISPQMGKSHTAMFICEKPVPLTGPATVSITLDCTSQYAEHVLGKFRVSVSSNESAALDGGALPPDLHAILAVARDKRSPEQTKTLVNYYHSIAPEMKAARERAEQLAHLDDPIYPLTTQRSKAVPLSVVLTRAPGFTGDVKLTLEGFNSGSKEGDEPLITQDLDMTALTLKGAQDRGVITITPKGNCPFITRDIVIRAESGTPAVVVYSDRIALTVKEKK